jgi:hypothetical protein
MKLEQLKLSLSKAENHAPDSELAEIAWMVGGFPVKHPVRKQALGLRRLQKHVAKFKPCTSEISTIMRVKTHCDDHNNVGAVANSIHAILCAHR